MSEETKAFKIGLIILGIGIIIFLLLLDYLKNTTL